MTLLEHLRNETNALHQQLDSNSPLAQLTTAELTQQRYADILNLLYQPQKQLEQVLLPAINELIPAYQLEARHGLIEQDIAHLGSEITQPADWPKPLSSQAEVLGVLYVLEGSKLGGRFILSNLKKVLPELPHYFFSSSDLSAKSFRQNLTQASEGLTTADYEQAAHSAREAFKLFIATCQHD